MPDGGATAAEWYRWAGTVAAAPCLREAALRHLGGVRAPDQDAARHGGPLEAEGRRARAASAPPARQARPLARPAPFVDGPAGHRVGVSSGVARAAGEPGRGRAAVAEAAGPVAAARRATAAGPRPEAATPTQEAV